MIKHTDERNSVKLKSKSTQPTATVKVGYEDAGKGGSGAKMDSSIMTKGKSGVGTGGTDASKKGTGAENYFSELASKANTHEIYPSAAK